MSELSNAILGIYRDAERRHYFGVSSVSPCARETFLNYRWFQKEETGELAQVKQDLQLQLLLNDGHYQEAEVVDLLKRAGYLMEYTGDKQFDLLVGESNLPGHPDGFIKKQDTDERFTLLEVKARNYSAFKRFEEEGIAAFPQMMTQIQLYMHAKNIPYPVTRARLIFKHKESVRMHDELILKDSRYAEPIIEATDKIILQGWEPEAKRIPMCGGCKWEGLCWGNYSIDFKGFAFKSLPEAERDFIRGKAMVSEGEQLVASAQAVFNHEIGDKATLLTDGLQVKRVSFVRRDFKKDKYLLEHSDEEFNKFCDFNEINFLRVTPT